MNSRSKGDRKLISDNCSPDEFVFEGRMGLMKRGLRGGGGGGGGGRGGGEIKVKLFSTADSQILSFQNMKMPY